ncbi:MAG TPA: PilZ domain-containing protein [Terriglobales bacterium]|nr:PilZ domain-containing protein [Terriglobales bacterium]
MRALVVTTDPLLLTTFKEVSVELGIESQPSTDICNLSEQLTNTKYAGVVLDFDTISSAVPAVACVRNNRTNPNAVIFAVASDAAHRDEALLHGAHFLLHRPIQSSEIRQTLSAAYDLMYKERRRYFRCAAELPVIVVPNTTGLPVKCSTINVSSDGIGVKSSVAFILGQALDITLTLPDDFVISATGIVIWDDKHGKSGIKFTCRNPEMRHRLDSWLDSKFSKERTEAESPSA